MASNFKYVLDKSSKKFICPECNKRTWKKYVDTEYKGYLPEKYGRCDREIKCQYKLNPYQDGYQKDQNITAYNWNKTKSVVRSKPILNNFKPTFIPHEVLSNTLRSEGYKLNVFIQNLIHRVPYPFSRIDLEKVISQYYLGTVCDGYMTGAITFPFIDIQGMVRAIQVKKFDEFNHTSGTNFIHALIANEYSRKNETPPTWLGAYEANDLKVSCLFGEHLLNKYPMNPIALVEAPKTAIYGTLYLGFPENQKNLLWLAVFNLSSLNFEKCKSLSGRDVYLFPDLSPNGKAFNLWSNKAQELTNLMPGTFFKMSDLLEKISINSMKESGSDIADILIKLDWRKFRNNRQSEKGE
jgi:hypothetical protein